MFQCYYFYFIIAELIGGGRVCPEEFLERRNAWVKFERLDISFCLIYSLTSPFPHGKGIYSGWLLKSIMHAFFKFSCLEDRSGPMFLRKTMGAGVWHSARLSLKAVLTLVNVNITPEETFLLL